MSTQPGKAALITGANAGIGKEVARQLALRPEFSRIYLACRNQDRAKTAKAELEAVTGRHIFDIILMNVADLRSVRAGVTAIEGSVDAVIMNAGVIGDKKLMNLTADGVTTLFATNVLGHAVLLDALLMEKGLGEVAVFVGSEAAVNAHPKQPHVRIENSHTWLMCKSASVTWLTPLSLRTFWFGTAWWRPEVGNFLPSSR